MRPGAIFDCPWPKEWATGEYSGESQFRKSLAELFTGEGYQNWRLYGFDELGD